MLSEVSQTEKDMSYDIAYMWNLKQWYKCTQLQNRNRVTDVENNLIVTSEEVGRDKWETGTDIHTLLYIKQKTNKDLLYSTGNSGQCSLMTYMGKESKKEWIWVYV